MSNNAKSVEYSSEEEEDESEEEEEEEQPRAANTKIQAKTQERQPQEEEETSSEEEDSETDNDGQRFNTVRRDATPAAVKTDHAANLVGKRGRDGELKEEGPAQKKNKESRGDRGKAPVKPASPPRTNRADASSKESKAQVSKAKPEKNKPQLVERDEHSKASAANKKRKVSPPPPVNGGTKHRTDATEKNSPMKPKTPFMWTNNLEIALATMLWNDKKHGRPIPSGTKNDPYWAKLVKELSSEGVTMTEAQLSEKVRRMKNKWKTFKEKEAENPWRNPHEQKIFGIWEGIWGTGVVSEKQPSRPATSHGAANEEEEEESSSEEEEEEVGTPAVGVSRGPVQPSRKEESSESEDEEEEEEPDVPPKKSGTSHDGSTKEGTAFSPTAIVSPFVSKPRLEYTPILPKDKKKARKGEEASIAEQNGAEESAEEEDRNGQTSAAVAELLNSLKKESFTILQEVRASCLNAVNNICKQTTTVLDDMKDTNSRLGVNMPTSGIWRMNSGTVLPVDRGFLEELMISSLRAGTNPSMAAELKGQWRKLRVEEMDLLERRINLTLKQLQLARKEFQEQDK